MGEPVLRLVIPDTADGPDQARRWPAASKLPAAEVAPAEGATNGATDTAVNGATERATIPAVGLGEGATTGPAAGATNPTAGTAADPAGGPDGLPELQPVGRQMTAGERAARLARHWLATAREDATRPGELVHAVWHGKPESLAEIHRYAVSRARVPDEYEGSLVPALGAIYSHTIAKGGTALGLFIIWVTQRALRLLTFGFVCGVLAALFIAFG